MIIHTGQTKSRWDQCGRCLPIEAKPLAIQNQLSVKFPRSPGIEHGFYRTHIDTQEIGNGGKLGARLMISPTLLSIALIA
jgi:hypothetical protein